MICALGLFCSVILYQFNVPFQYGYVSRFQYPGILGIVLLAHSYNDGSHFYGLDEGDSLWYYDEGKIWTEYIIDEMYWMQAIPPDSTQPQLIDIVTKEKYQPIWIYQNIYGKGLTLQTCFTVDNNPIWGRLFIHAEKKEVKIVWLQKLFGFLSAEN